MFINTQTKTALSSLSMLVLSGFASPVAAEIHDLYAGQFTRVGTVEVTTTAGLTTVDYKITLPGWCLGTTHLYAETQPPTSGAPGQFTYQHVNLCAQSDHYEFPAIIPASYMAAHAEVTHWGMPVGGIMDVRAFRDAQTTSYYSVNFKFNASDPWETAGMAPGWCVDLDKHISLNKEYLGCDVFSSLDFNAPVDKPENLDLVNYVLNTDYAAIPIAGVTKKEIQAAIWYLIDNQSFTSPTGGIKWNQGTVDAILANAYANGEGFVPGAGDVIAFIVKCGTKIQVFEMVVNFADVMLGSETAWTIDGYPFLNSHGQPTGWGTYFEYQIPQ